MRILVVEDEATIAQRVSRLLSELLGEKLESLEVVESFAQAMTFLETNPIDLLTLDLNLDGDDGFALLETAVAGTFHTIVISAHTERALEAFEHGVLDFVPKPFTRARLAKALDRYQGSIRSGKARFLAVKKTGTLRRVATKEIRYIQAAGPYSQLILCDGTHELHAKTLERLEAVLPSCFLRCHRSCIVNLNHVSKLVNHEGSRYELILDDDTLMPVGRTRVLQLREKLGGG